MQISTTCLKLQNRIPSRLLAAGEVLTAFAAIVTTRLLLHGALLMGLFIYSVLAAGCQTRPFYLTLALAPVDPPVEPIAGIKP